MKRYGAFVGKRPEYTLKLTTEEKELSSKRRNEVQQAVASEGNVAAPPLPERETQPDNNAEAPPLPEQAPLPPLPPAAAAAAGVVPVIPLPGAEPGNEQPEVDMADAEAAASGVFIPNDALDEGVQVVDTFLHGTAVEERMAGPGTRSRRAAVKVHSLALCPVGGHFATGATDGICRIWEDIEDGDVDLVDNRACKLAYDWPGGPIPQKEAPKRRSCESANLICTQRILFTLLVILTTCSLCVHLQPEVQHQIACCFN